MDGGRNQGQVRPVVMDLHLQAVVHHGSQQHVAGQVAHDGQSVTGVPLGLLVGRKTSILVLSPRDQFLFRAEDPEVVGSLQTLLEALDKAVLVIIVVLDDLLLNTSEDPKDGGVEGEDSGENSHRREAVGADEEHRHDQDNGVLVDAQQFVAGDKDFLVILS